MLLIVAALISVQGWTEKHVIPTPAVELVSGGDRLFMSDFEDGWVDVEEKNRILARRSLPRRVTFQARISGSRGYLR